MGKQINKILLLTDFSEVSNHATHYALNIAQQVKSEVVILHVINTPVDWVKLPLDKERLYPETKSEIGSAKTKLADLVKEFEGEGIKTTQSLVFNLGVEDIPQYISKDKHDLIIMGSHGSKGIKKYGLGSNAQKVIRSSQVPVLIVKSPPKSESIKRIVMASTFEDSQKDCFKRMFNYASDLGADVDLLYINTPYHFKETEDIDKMLTSFCEDCPKKSCGKHHVDALNEERGIQFFMNDSNADFLAIATKGKSPFSRLFSASLTESVVNNLTIPVLVFRQ
ncbi:MAG: universal stress protein [Saprospirales bacterium]|nr:MAG: universal stress protein [Saprospirales bacterium]